MEQEIIDKAVDTLRKRGRVLRDRRQANRIRSKPDEFLI